jgi:hypothetical protein
VVQFKYINLCGGGLGEDASAVFGTGKLRSYCKHNSNIIEKLNTSKIFAKRNLEKFR